MSSILNSISSGDLQVQYAPREIPVKEDSIINLLKNSEIEFEIVQKPETSLKPDFIFDDAYTYEPPSEDSGVITDDMQTSISELLENSQVEVTICPTVGNKFENVNTGFSDNNDLHYKDTCAKPELKVPLYKDNYFNEFVTEEEKTSARQSLGIYTKGDVVSMALLTVEESFPSKADWNNAIQQQLRKGNKFFTPLTAFKAVYDQSGVNLETRFLNIQALVSEQKEKLDKVINPTNSDQITSLGDVALFLQGFNNGNNLHATITEMNQEMLRFEQLNR